MFQKFIKSLFLSLTILSCFSFISPIVSAYTDPMSSGIFEWKLPAPQADSSFKEMLTWLIDNNLVYYVKWIMVSISIGYISFYWFMYITARGKEDQVSEQNNNLLWAIIGFAVIGVSNLALDIFKPESSTNAINVNEVNDAIMNIVVFIEYMLWAIASLYMLIGAIRFIMANGDTEVMDTQKRNFTWGLFGLIIVMIADTFINLVYDKQTKTFAGERWLEKGSQEIFGVVNFLLAFMAVIAVLTLVVSGIYYVTSLGDEEATNRAKGIIKTTIIGFIVISLAYVVVATFAS